MMNTDSAQKVVDTLYDALVTVTMHGSPREVTEPFQVALNAAKRHLDECRRYNRQYDPRTLPQS
jgi:hypothetical protein